LDYISALVVSQQMSVAVLAGASNAGQSAEMYQLSGGTYLGTLPGQYSDVWKVRISADGEWLAAVEQNLRTLIGWNLRERRFLGRLTLESCVEDICFLGTAMKVAVATERGGVEVVDVPRMEREPLIGGVEEQVTALASHSGEEVLLYTSSREALAIWEIKGLLA
jgi:WD40 repeat protein